MKTPTEAVESMPANSKYFSCIDATTGYWQLELDESSKDLTCFMTPWQRYIFNRSPIGFVATGDGYNLRVDHALEGIQNVQKVVDDVAVADKTFPEHVARIREVLDRCRKHGITLNKDKFHFAQEKIHFVGYVLSNEGIGADSSKVQAIQDFPEPSNRSELRSFMGLVHQLGQFSSQISAAAGPLREALKTKNEFAWTVYQSKAMEDVKRVLLSPPILAKFDPEAVTALHTDASRKNGLGFALMQKQNGKWCLISCGSRFITDTESRYAMVELECLAIVWATKKCRLFLAGLPSFTVVTDHRPLIPILNQQSYAQIENPRLLRYRIALSSYIFKAEWRKGKDHCIPDALSRAPVRDPLPDEVEESEINDEVKGERREVIRVAVLHSHAAVDEIERETNVNFLVDPVLEEIRKIAREDTEYQQLIDAIENGSEAPAQYKKILDELSTDDGLVLFGPRLVIPRQYRREVLKHLHNAHQGIEKTKRRARQTVYYPGINSDITNTVESCPECQIRLPSLPKEPLIQDVKPSRVYEVVTVDLFTLDKKHFLVYSDRLSGFPSVAMWNKDPSSADVIKVVLRLFVSTGVPVRLRSDGGPQFSSEEFQSFLHRWGVEWMPSSPHYAQSNGHAESNVRIIKALAAKTKCKSIDDEAFLQGLLELRNSPRGDNRSPAQVVYGHPIRSKMPMHWRAYAKEWQTSAEECERKAAEAEEKTKLYYDRTARSLKPIKVGSQVLIQDPASKRWTKSGTVMSVGKNRDYRVVTPSGRTYWRNRRFLRPKVQPQNPENNAEDVGEEKVATLRRSTRPKRNTVRFSF